MVFFGKGIVWNPKEAKKLCKFVDGRYETSVQAEIEVLKALGYKHDEAEATKEETTATPKKKISVKKGQA